MAVGLGPWQLAWLAAAVFVVSAGYGALMPLLPAWLTPLIAAGGRMSSAGVAVSDASSAIPSGDSVGSAEISANTAPASTAAN